MAVSLPSDIILDVVNAITPLDLRKAHAKLVAKSNPASGPEAGQFLAATRNQATGPGSAKAPVANGSVSSANVGERFEAMVMQVMLQSMLPSDMEQVYGSGLAGDMWKSMLAEKIAESMARHGQLGIASNLLKDVVRQGEQNVALSGVTDMRDVLPQHRDTDVSNARVLELQRTMLKAVDRLDDAVSP